METVRGNTNEEKRAKRTRAEWAAEVNRWRESGQGCGQYARAHDLHPGTLSYWASRLKKGSTPKAPKPTKRSKRFVPVRLVDGADIESRKTPDAVGEFEVVLSNGRTVRVTGAYQPEALSRLLLVVEGMKSC